MSNIVSPASVIALGQKMYPNVGWQRPLAKEVGTSQTTLNFWLKGERKLSDESVAKLADLIRQYGISVPSIAFDWVASAQVAPVGPVANVVLTFDPSRIREKTATSVYSNAELRARINTRFDVVTDMVNGVIIGEIPSLIISGKPGLGKSYITIKQFKKAQAEGKYVDIISGSATAPGLYQALYHAKDGGLILIDDCDSILTNEEALSLLKPALNSDNRHLSWRKIVNWIGNEEGQYPNSFEFNGGIVFISNLDFMEKIESGSSMGKHIEALISRSLYVDLEIDTTEEKLERVLQGIDEFGVLAQVGITDTRAVEEITAFVAENADRYQELSFRTAEKVGRFYKSGKSWRETSKVTLFKRAPRLPKAA